MFSEEHELFRQTVRRFVETEINPRVEEWEAARIFPAHQLFRKMGELGMLGPSYPQEYGGAGGDYAYHVVLFEELGRADCMAVPMAVMVQTDSATPALAEHGTDDLKRTFLAPAIRGEQVCAIAVSEPGAGSDVAAITTRAVREGDHYRIYGSKLWITNGTQADWVCLLCRTSDEPGHRSMSLLVVPTDLPGFSVSRKIEKLGMHASDTAELSFDGVQVPVSNRIGPEGMGFVLQMQQFQKERLAGSVMAIHFRLCELLTEIECLRQLNYHCARRLMAGEDITREASMAKLKAGRLAREVADTCLQFHGGMGYAEEYPIARYYRDARLISIGGGADEIMLGILARLEGMLPR